MDRRQMIRSALVGGGAIALPGLGLGAPTPKDAATNGTKMPYGVLGRTGVQVSRLAVGCAQMGFRDEITVEDVRQVLFRALELGVNYLDTAPNYSRAEEKMGPTIKEIRDKVFLVTKTEEPSYEGTWRLLRQSLKRLQTDHLDLVHIHNFGEQERFVDPAHTLGDKGALGALREAKKQGVIRFIGASGHFYPSRFHAVLDTDEIDVLMNAVNFVAQHVYDFEHKVWSRARHKNLGLAAMKVLGGSGQGGKGFQLPEATYEQAIRYALSIPGVSCAVIGLATVAEVERAAKTVAEAQPLSEDEQLELYRQGFELARTPSWRAPYGRPTT